VTRMWKVLAASLGTAGLLAVAASADLPSLSAELVASGFSEPVFVTAPDDDPRLFVVERAGNVKIVKDGAVLPVAFLDITSLVSTVSAYGFFGLAFAPDYETSGFFYVYYMNPADESIIARYSVSANPDIADAGSGETVFAIAQPGTDHNGGMIDFSPVDGYLYLGLGDGGTGPRDPLENAQDPQKLLGKSCAWT
jgi:glucose/arabinose dehydrogenase